MNPLLLAALIGNVGIPELARLLHDMHSEGKVLTEEEALAILDMDSDEGDAAGLAFLASHPKT